MNRLAGSTSPLLAGLRAAYPGARLDVLASPSNIEVFQAECEAYPEAIRRMAQVEVR